MRRVSSGARSAAGAWSRVSRSSLILSPARVAGSDSCVLQAGGDGMHRAVCVDVRSVRRWQRGRMRFSSCAAVWDVGHRTPWGGLRILRRWRRRGWRFGGVRYCRLRVKAMARWIRIKRLIEDDRGVRRKARPLRSIGTIKTPIRKRFRLDMSYPSDSPQKQSVRIARWILWSDTPSPRMRFALNALFALVLIGSFGLGVLSNMEALESWRSDIGWLEVMSVIALPIYFLLFFAASRLWIRRGRRLILTLPHTCVVCGYDMSGLKPEGDCCTVCPECGASWRFPIRGPWRARAAGSRPPLFPEESVRPTRPVLSTAAGGRRLRVG
jgi:hypothetical protein